MANDYRACDRRRRARVPAASGRHAAVLLAAALFLQGTNAAALWDDRLELFVAETVTRDDNVFRISGDVDPATVLGSLPKADTYRTTSVGFNFDVPAGRQRFEGGWAWNDVRYNQLTFLDLTGHAGRAAWLWQAGGDLSGKLGYAETLALASLANIQSGMQSTVPDPLTTRHGFFNATYRLTPRWQVLGDVARIEQLNEDPARQVNDIVIDRADLTLNYVTPANNRIGLGTRVAEGRYPNPQPVAGRLIDNAYRDQRVTAVVEWSPTGVSRLRGRAGRVQREYEELPQRNFDSPTFLVECDWTPTAKLKLTAIAGKEISEAEEVNIGFVFAKGASLRPVLRLTEKISLAAHLAYSNREHLGDPGRLLGTVPPRTDRVRVAEATVAYRPLRHLALQLSWLYERRSSSVVFGDYEVNVAGASVRIGF